MSIRYSKNETIKILEDAVHETKIHGLYNEDCVNWKGVIRDGNIPYTEVIAGELLNNLDNLKSIQQITRNATYHRQTHSEVSLDLGKSNRYEEMFAKRLTGLELPEIGLVKDYQVPLKNTSKDKGVGKIDLISYNQNKMDLYLLELKYKNNDETLLRAMLEAYTYFQIVDEERLKDDLLNDYDFKKNHFSIDLSPDKINVLPAVLLSKECRGDNELQELKRGERQNLKKLAQELNIRMFTIHIDCQSHEL